MKTFIYTIKSGKAPSNGSGIKKTLKIWQLVRGQLKPILTETYTFKSDFQAVLEALETMRPNLLPELAHEKSQFGGHKHCAWTLKEAKLVNFIHVPQL